MRSGRSSQSSTSMGLDKSTIICFTSDNGGVSSGDAYATSNLATCAEGKARQWEGGIREPFYLKAPGITKPGSTSDTLVSGVDWYPTILELCNIQTAQKSKRWTGLVWSLSSRENPFPTRPLVLALSTLWQPRRRT